MNDCMVLGMKSGSFTHRALLFATCSACNDEISPIQALTRTKCIYLGTPIQGESFSITFVGNRLDWALAKIRLYFFLLTAENLPTGTGGKTQTRDFIDLYLREYVAGDDVETKFM